ncbi:DUF3489 domain-containing protein [Acuticoccus sp.]|uniref:DUF3489 domain-containing protein n=1 Tax=Acuticoccus sp. TaxID=1904378 RepID=UPI003B52B8B7
MARTKSAPKSAAREKASAPRKSGARATAAARQAQGAAAEVQRAAATTSIQPSRPGGKLGMFVERLATDAGATILELAAATGWQRHTVHGALSRLRSRGFAMRLDSVGGRKAYRLVRSEA